MLNDDTFTLRVGTAVEADGGEGDDLLMISSPNLSRTELNAVLVWTQLSAELATILFWVEAMLTAFKGRLVTTLLVAGLATMLFLAAMETILLMAKEETILFLGMEAPTQLSAVREPIPSSNNNLAYSKPFAFSSARLISRKRLDSLTGTLNS